MLKDGTIAAIFGLILVAIQLAIYGALIAMLAYAVVWVVNSI